MIDQFIDVMNEKRDKVCELIDCADHHHVFDLLDVGKFFTKWKNENADIKTLTNSTSYPCQRSRTRCGYILVLPAWLGSSCNAITKLFRNSMTRMFARSPFTTNAQRIPMQTQSTPTTLWQGIPIQAFLALRGAKKQTLVRERLSFEGS